MKVTITTTIEVDIDKLSREEQIKLVRETLSPQEIDRTIKNDLFPLSRLVARVKVLQDFCPDLFGDDWRGS